jgi:hypothetical protein
MTNSGEEITTNNSEDDISRIEFLADGKKISGYDYPTTPVEVHCWSVRRVAWLLIRAPNALTSDDQAALDRVLEASPAILCAYQLAQDFQQIVRQRASEAFEPWLQELAGSGVPAPQTFAAGLEREKAAVLAALTLPWSNGQTEGQVNRLKLIKRSMYGRANFDLLRLRALYTGRDVRDCDVAVRVVVFVIKSAEEPILDE